MPAVDHEPDRNPHPAEGGVSGKLVLALLLVVSIASVVLGFAVIRPPEGAEPVPVNRRPFGPSVDSDWQDRPLIEKGRAAERRRDLTEQPPPEPIRVED